MTAHEAWRRAPTAPQPVPLTPAAWRASVERDAIAVGWSAERAAWLAREVTKPPPSNVEIAAMNPRMQALYGVRAFAVDELADLAAAVGCPALLPALRAAALPLAEVRALVRDAINPKTMTITGSRVCALRASLQARTYWKDHQQ